MSGSYYSVVPSPIGELTLRWEEDALVGLYFDNNAAMIAQRSAWTRDDALLAPVAEQLAAYFAGSLAAFDLPLRLEGSAFQKDVWRELQAIPLGSVISYGEQAKRIGRANSSSARAVGAANGKNPIAIIVPCHRVIGANGALTGFGGGIAKKMWLLDHEKVDRASVVTPRRATPQLSLS